MQSKAATVEQYLRELPPERREIVEAVRRVVLDNIDPQYQEVMQYGMIGYVVPHSLYPAGYHCDPKQPLPFACLASQKNYLSLYMMTVYIEEGDQAWFQKAWKATGKKLDMGKSCIRFKKLDDLALDVIGEALRRMPVARYVEVYETCIMQQRKSSRKKVATQRAVKNVKKKSGVKKAVGKKDSGKKSIAKKRTGRSAE